MNAFLAAFLHDLAGFWRNPSSAIVGIMCPFFAWLFHRMGFYPSFSAALTIQLIAGSVSTVGFLSAMGEEREQGAWGAVARTSACAEALVAGRLSACLLTCLALSALCAALAGVEPVQVPFALLAALPTILPATLLSFALGLVAPDQSRANAWGTFILMPCILPTLCAMFIELRLWPLPSYATTELLGVAASRGLAPFPAAVLAGVSIAWIGLGYAAFSLALRRETGSRRGLS